MKPDYIILADSGTESTMDRRHLAALSNNGMKVLIVDEPVNTTMTNLKQSLKLDAFQYIEPAVSGRDRRRMRRKRNRIK
jgi:hypothetical protein